MVTIVLAEDHALVRKGLRTLLETESTFRLLAEAQEGLEAIHLVEKLHPDVLLLDLTIPRLHGLEVIKRVRQDTKTQVIVVSMHSDEPYVVEALKSGASGYVLKESTPEELVQAIRTVAGGGHFVSPSLRHIALSASFGKSAGQRDPLESLTSRERIVLQFAAEGLSNAHIAQKLFISGRTVESHRASILRKLDLKSQTDLVRFAIRKQIIAV